MTSLRNSHSENRSEPSSQALGDPEQQVEPRLEPVTMSTCLQPVDLTKRAPSRYEMFAKGQGESKKVWMGRIRHNYFNYPDQWDVYQAEYAKEVKWPTTPAKNIFWLSVDRHHLV